MQPMCFSTKKKEEKFMKVEAKPTFRVRDMDSPSLDKDMINKRDECENKIMNGVNIRFTVLIMNCFFNPWVQVGRLMFRK